MPTECLVQYGRTAFVGRFASDGLAPDRGTAVVVCTPRGVEVGTVLCPADGRYAAAIDPTAQGELLRSLTRADEETAANLDRLGRELLDAAERAAAEAGLPLSFVDAEVLFDGPAILHAVAWDACDADPLFAQLSARFGRPVRLHDVARAPTAKDPPPATCGKPDCGSGGCSDGGCGTKPGGCSTGGCSRKAVKSADELTAYFAGLRKQMEAARTPLN